MARTPDVAVNFYLIEHGYQADIYTDGKLILSPCRDYGDNVPNRDVHIITLLGEVEQMLNRLRERFRGGSNDEDS